MNSINSNMNGNINGNINTNINNNKNILVSTRTTTDYTRTKYIIGLVCFIIIFIALYIYNPFHLFTKYAGPTIFISIALTMFLLFMIVYYDYVSKNPNASTIVNPKSLFVNVLLLSVGFLVSAGVIVLLLWLLGMFSPNHSPNSIIGFFINFLLLFVMLSIVYKIFMLTKWGNNPLIKAILQTIFYLPCLFVNLIEMITNEYKKTTKTIVILFCIVILLWILYFVYPTITKKVYSEGGNIVVNQPIPLNMEQQIATYQTLNGTDEFKYQYGLSFWFYIDSMPPNTNANYNKFTNILSYGNNPSISYNANANTLRITVGSNNKSSVSVVDIIKQNENNMEETIYKVKNVSMINEFDDNDKRIIYNQKNVLLQKWNNIILNYSGGTLDVFYNGKLMKSAIEVVPYLTYDTLVIGAPHGISGGIANVTYFTEPLSIFKINNLYNNMKDKNPPSV